MTTVKAYV